jgi:hypothetical protein
MQEGLVGLRITANFGGLGWDFFCGLFLGCFVGWLLGFFLGFFVCFFVCFWGIGVNPPSLLHHSRL